MPDRDYEDVTVYSLDESAEAELLAKQAECTFIWSNSSGHPRLGYRGTKIADL
jgi:hypothetical protein